MKYLNVIFVLLFCSFFKENHCDVADRVAKKFIKNFTKPQRLEVFGYGGGMMFGTINSYKITFETEESVGTDIDKARFKLVYLVENFLYYINSSEAVKYLAKFPYDENEMELGIVFCQKDGRFVEFPNIVLVKVYDGIVRYSVDNLDKTCIEPIHSESYAEAYEKVMGIPFSERNLLDFRCTCRDHIESK